MFARVGIASRAGLDDTTSIADAVAGTFDEVAVASAPAGGPEILPHRAG